MKNILMISALGIGLAFAIGAGGAYAATDCTFTTNNKKKEMRLNGDCTTDATILILNKFTLDGQGFIITAEDPPLGTFVGGVVSNSGAVANVTNLIIDTATLAIACHAGADRLRGILFDGASGSITNNTVLNINQGPSGCQEGNAIEVRNAPFDGTHPATKSVTISNNRIFDWQKGGIVANGDVKVDIKGNIIGGSATQANLAANSIQIGFGGKGEIEKNVIEGNTWLGFNSITSDFAATAILLFDASSGVEVEDNNINLIGGNADIGIYVQANNAKVKRNRVYDVGADVVDVNTVQIYDIGIGDYGLGNVITGNKVRCYDTPFDGFVGTGNTVVPCPGGLSLTSLGTLTSVAATAQPSPVEP